MDRYKEIDKGLKKWIKYGEKGMTEGMKNEGKKGEVR
jgi:hypothetical protein